MSLKLNLVEQSSLLSKLLHLVDCFCIVLFLWMLTRFWHVEWSDCYSYLLGATFVLSFISFYSFHLYRSWRGRKLYRELFLICKAWAAVVGILLFLLFLSKTSQHFSRSLILTWFGLSPVVVFGVHLLVRKILKIVRSKGYNIKTAVIVGAGDLGQRLARHIENMPWAGIEVKGFFDDYKPAGDHVLKDKQILGTIEQLPEYLTRNKVDVIYIALPTRAESKILSTINTTRTQGVAVYFVPDIFAFGLLNAEMEFLGNMLLFNFTPTFPSKRYFDIVFSLFALLVTLPVTLMIALLIKLEDGGPIFYGHRRVTVTGKVFKCLKFRSMIVGADEKLAEILSNNSAAREEWEKTYKLKNDPRTTRVGRFLRKTSLDELPQFINVLKGEMSVVGARPVVHAELCNYYRENAGLYCSMKPGITGPWQIGKRSDTEDYDERVELDTWYVLNHSIWLDLGIIIKTVLRIFTGKGAY